MSGFYSKCDGKPPEYFKQGQTGSNRGFENLGLCEDLATRRPILKLSQSSGDRQYKRAGPECSLDVSDMPHVLL